MLLLDSIRTSLWPTESTANPQQTPSKPISEDDGTLSLFTTWLSDNTTWLSDKMRSVWDSISFYISPLADIEENIFLTEEEIAEEFHLYGCNSVIEQAPQDPVKRKTYFQLLSKILAFLRKLLSKVKVRISKRNNVNDVLEEGSGEGTFPIKATTNLQENQSPQDPHEITPEQCIALSKVIQAAVCHATSSSFFPRQKNYAALLATIGFNKAILKSIHPLQLLYYMISEHKENFIILMNSDYHMREITSRLVKELIKMNRKEVLSNKETLDDHYISLFVEAIAREGTKERVENCIRDLFREDQWKDLLRFLTTNPELNKSL